MSELLFCIVMVALSLVAIVAIFGMTIYSIAKLRTQGQKDRTNNKNISEVKVND